MQKKRWILMFLAITAIFLVACNNIEERAMESSSQERAMESSSQEGISDFTEKQKEIIKNGYKLDDYTFYFMNGQKDEKGILKDMFSDFDERVVANFEKSKDRIVKTEKINMIPTRITYEVNKGELVINYFLVNNWHETINSIYLKGHPTFKTGEKIEDVDFWVSNQVLGSMPQNSIILFSLSYPMTLEFSEKIDSNKVPDLGFVITELKINDEKVDNTNEN